MSPQSPQPDGPVRGGDIWLVLVLAALIWFGDAALDILVFPHPGNLATHAFSPGVHQVVARLLLILSVGVALVLIRRLRAQRDHTAAILNSLEDEIALLDHEGRITWVNEAWRRFGASRGGDPHGYVGEPYLRPLDPERVEDGDDSAERFAAGLQGVLDGSLPEFSMGYLFREPGTPRWFRVTVSPFRNPGNHGVVVAHTDITTQKLARAASMEQEMRFRRAVDLAPFPTMLHAEDGEVLRVNQAWTESTGYEPLEIPTLADWVERASGEQHDFLKRFIGQLDAGEGRRRDGEFLVRTRSGSERIWDFSSVALGTLDDGRRIVLSMAADVTARARAEADAARTRDELRAIFDASPAPMMTLDDAGHVRSWNPAAEKLFGWTEGEALGKPPPFVPREHQQEFRRLLDRVLSGEPLKGVELVRHARDGRALTLSLSAGPILDEDGEVAGLAAITADISDRKKAETQLIRLNRSLRTLSASSRAVARKGHARDLLDEICRVAVEVGGHRTAWVALVEDEDGRAEAVAAAGDDLPRTEPGPEDEAAFSLDTLPGRCAAREALRTGETCIVRQPGGDPLCRCRAPHGEGAETTDTPTHGPVVAVPLALDGRVAGVLTVVLSDPALLEGPVRTTLEEVGRDLAHGLTVASTFQELRLLRSAVEALDLGISIADARKPGSPVVFANRGVVEMTGFSREELLGRPFHFLAATVEDAELGELDELRSAMETGELTQVALGLSRKSGERYWNRVTLDAIQDGSGHITHLVAVEEDVTERRRMGRELEHRERLSALGQLAGGVAHDIRNLLTAIGGLVDLTLQEEPEWEGTRANLREIKALLPRSRSVLNRLLAFSRREDLDARPVDLPAALRDGVKLLHTMLRDDVEILTDLEETAWVRIDPGQLQQLVFNVAMNAQHAMPDGGELRIQARTDHSGVGLPAMDVPREELPDRWVWVSMEDTGVGMDADVRARAFEPFFTTKATGRGTGLGLSSCYGLISGSGGRIWLDSEPGKGTTLHFVLPRIDAPDAAEHAPGQAGTGEPSSCRPTTVLLAEDEPSIRRTFRRFLEKDGHRVLAASDGAEALTLFQEDPWAVELVVTDAMMPRMSGIELSRRILEVRPDLPVILISGYVSRELPDLPLSGRIELLHKPFDLTDLREAVARTTGTEGDQD